MAFPRLQADSHRRSQAHRRFWLRLAGSLLLLAVSGCAAQDGRIADTARQRVIGFTPTDMRMCAGFPNQTYSEGNTTFWSYKVQAAAAGGIAVSTPLSVVPGLSQTTSLGTPSGSCSMQVRFVNGRVEEIAYSGDSDMAGIANAYCAPLIKSCLAYQPRHPVPQQPASPPQFTPVPQPVQPQSVPSPKQPPVPNETTQAIPAKAIPAKSVPKQPPLRPAY